MDGGQNWRSFWIRFEYRFNNNVARMQHFIQYAIIRDRNILYSTHVRHGGQRNAMRIIKHSFAHQWVLFAVVQGMGWNWVFWVAAGMSLLILIAPSSRRTWSVIPARASPSADSTHLAGQPVEFRQ